MKKRNAIILAIMLVFSNFVVVGAAISDQLKDNNIKLKHENQPCSTLQSDDDITISFSKAPLSLGINIEIQNNGNKTYQDVPWSFRAKPQISGTGLIYKDQIASGVIDQLDANELVTIPLRPLIKQTRILLCSST